MIYKQVSIPVGIPTLSDMIVALLADVGYEGFEETENVLFAFIPSSQFDEEVLACILQPHGLSFSVVDIPKVNWNREWEENFEPVVVDEFCTIRAHFHDLKVRTPYEIVITPKMSFGTGHHATTQCMISMMQRIDFKGKTVLDFGTGTGILAILASMLGSVEVIAIDNEDWASENAIENVQGNGITNVDVRLGSLDQVTDMHFDIILANINRHILLEYMQEIYELTNTGGLVLMSGLLEEDRDIVLQSAVDKGFAFTGENSLDKWIALSFAK